MATQMNFPQFEGFRNKVSLKEAEVKEDEPKRGISEEQVIKKATAEEEDDFDCPVGCSKTPCAHYPKGRPK